MIVFNRSANHRRGRPNTAAGRERTPGAAADQELAEFPPRQKPASFSLDRVLEKLQEVAGSQS